MAEPQSETAASIAVLPAEALVQIFSNIDTGDRQKAVPLVCRYWRHLCSTSPELLQRVHIGIGGPACLPRMRSLCKWLVVRAAAHVEVLELELNANRMHEDGDDEVRELLTECLTACGAAGKLTYLGVNLGPLTFQFDSWVLALSSLKHLRVTAEEVQARASLRPMTALVDMEVHSYLFELAATLPGSLTRLHIGNCMTSRLPQQLSALTQLRELSVGPALKPDWGYEVLAALTSLRDLRLKHVAWLPSCFSLLTMLTVLKVRRTSCQSWEHVDVADLDVGLRPLISLQRLVLVMDLGMLPDSLAGLSQLRSFCWRGKALKDPALPAGPWLASLQQLEVPVSTAARSRHLLSDAAQLKRLAVRGFPAPCRRSHMRILEWAGQHATLRTLALEVQSSALTPCVLDAIASAQQHNRQLTVAHGAAAGFEEVFDNL